MIGVLRRAVRRLRARRYRRLARGATLETRGYRPGDERAIIRLFRIAFGKRKSRTRWSWEFLENPYGVANIALVDSDKAGIIGHYGGVLVRFNLHGEVIPVAQNVDVMIHPAFRSRATFDRLARAYVEISRANGLRLLFGFNDRVVARSNRRFFGAGLTTVSEWIRELSEREAVREPLDHEPAIGRVRHFDAEADALWARARQRYPCAAVRDHAYLNWRYSARSERDYVLCQATDRSSGRMVGLAVFGASGPDGLILELLANGDETGASAVTALVRASIVHFTRAGKRRVRAWLPVHGHGRGGLQAMGFRAVDSGLYLNLLALDDAIDPASLREEFYYTLGDYDVY